MIEICTCSHQINSDVCDSTSLEISGCCHDPLLLQGLILCQAIGSSGWQLLGEVEQRTDAEATEHMCWESTDKLKRHRLETVTSRWAPFLLSH